MANEYTSSPVLHPATQILSDGYVRSTGTTAERSERKYAGSLNISLTGTVRKSSRIGKVAGSCRTLSWSCDSVLQASRAIAARSRRFSDASAYSRKS